MKQRTDWRMTPILLALVTGGLLMAAPAMGSEERLYVEKSNLYLPKNRSQWLQVLPSGVAPGPDWRLQIQLSGEVTVGDLVDHLVVMQNGQQVQWALRDDAESPILKSWTSDVRRMQTAVFTVSPKAFRDGRVQTRVILKKGLKSVDGERLQADYVEEFESRSRFTLTGLIPSTTSRSVTLVFDGYVPIRMLREKLRVLPRAAIFWQRVRRVPLSHGMGVELFGSFKLGKKIGFKIPHGTPNGLGQEYYESIKPVVEIPEYAPSLELSNSQGVIERDGRQMLASTVTSVSAFNVDVLSIPPLLAARAQALLKGERKKSFAALKQALELESEALALAFSERPQLRIFAEGVESDRELFFNRVGNEGPVSFSVPLSFRESARRGSVTLVQLHGEGPNSTAQSAPSLFRVTDLGISYKISETDLLVWVTSLRTGLPLGGAAVMARAGDQAFYLGLTGEDGLLLVRKGKPCLTANVGVVTEVLAQPLKLQPEKLDSLIVASQEDGSYIEIKRKEGLKLPSGIPRGPRGGKENPFLATLFTERGVYRPGETVEFKGVLREFSEKAIRPPQRPKVILEILDSKEERVLRETLEPSEFGTVAGRFPIPAYAPLGTYTLKLDLEQDSPLAQRTFQVQEFRPPRHFAGIRFRRTSRPASEFVNMEGEEQLLLCTITGRYYAGGPVKNGKVRWKVETAPSRYEVEGDLPYEFGSLDPKNGLLLESGETLLDASGEATFELPLGESALAGKHGIRVSATVVDFDGRTASVGEEWNEPQSYLVGIRRHPKTLDAGTQQELEFVVLNPDRNTVEEGLLKLEILARSSHYVRKRQENGEFYWTWDQTWVRAFGGDLALKSGKATTLFDTRIGGEYLIQVSYLKPDGTRVASSTKLEVAGYWEGDEYQRAHYPERSAQIKLDRQEYKVGDQMRVKMAAHRVPAATLLTLERDGIFWHKVIVGKLDGEIIPLTKEYRPNIYLSALGTLPRTTFPNYRNESDSGAPGFVFGVISVPVRMKTGGLEIRIARGERELKAAPGENKTLELQILQHDGSPADAEVAVGVVDERVLALTRYTTPRLEGLLRFFQPLSVFSDDLRTSLVGQELQERLQRFTGGDGMYIKPPRPMASKIRKNFNPVAYFAPALRTDKEGRIQIKVKLPDTMTTYRIYAVACDRGRGFGSSELPLRVSSDFYIEPGVPRFLTKGDEFRFSVAAFNKTADAGMIRMSVESGPEIDLETAPQSQPIEAHDRLLIPVLGKATRAGKTSLTFEGSLAGKRDGIEIKLPVHSGYTPQRDWLNTVIRGEATMTYQFPEAILTRLEELAPDSVQVRLSLSRSGLSRVTPALRYLLRYPYGCVEQTSSKVLPLAGLRTLIAKGLLPGIGSSETDRYLKAGVDRILSMQTYTGGFAYWPGGRRPHPWGTIYALNALWAAAEAGYPVPRKQLDDAYKYLENVMNSSSDSSFRPTFDAMGAWLLARKGSLAPETYTRLSKNRDASSREIRALLLLAAQAQEIVPEEEVREKTLELLKETPPQAPSGPFRALHRGTALTLLLGEKLLPDEPGLFELAESLLGQMAKSGRWSSTADTGWALLAIARLYDTTDHPMETSFQIQQPGEKAMEISLNASGNASWSLDPKAFLENPSVKITTDFEGPIHATLVLDYPRVELAKEGLEAGFRVEKFIENTNDKETIRVGDIVRIRVQITPTRDQPTYLSYLVLDDPLPAGLVAINSALANEESPSDTDNQLEENGPADPNSQAMERWFGSSVQPFYPNFFEIRDDRVLAFRDSLYSYATFEFTYYARAVCAGNFVLPSTKAQLMYEPEVQGISPKKRFWIAERDSKTQ